MKNEITLNGEVYKRKSWEPAGESMFIDAVIPEYHINGFSILHLRLTQTEEYQVMPVTKFKPGMTIRVIIEKEN